MRRGHPNVLDDGQVAAAKQMRAERLFYWQIGSRLGCSVTTVRRALRGLAGYKTSSGAALAQEPLSTGAVSCPVPCAPGTASVKDGAAPMTGGCNG